MAGGASAEVSGKACRSEIAARARVQSISEHRDLRLSEENSDGSCVRGKEHLGVEMKETCLVSNRALAPARIGRVCPTKTQAVVFREASRRAVASLHLSLSLFLVLPRAEACGCHPTVTLVAIVLILGLAGCVV